MYEVLHEVHNIKIHFIVLVVKQSLLACEQALHLVEVESSENHEHVAPPPHKIFDFRF